jgi:preprotein translocase subunit SecF
VSNTTTLDTASPGSGAGPGSGPAKARKSLWYRLYNGETDYRIVPQWRRWFLASGLLVLIGIGFLVGRGLNLGIDFTGGTVWEVETRSADVGAARDALNGVGLRTATIQTLNSDSGERLRVKFEETSSAQRNQVTAAIAKFAKVSESDVTVTFVGPSWGRDITRKAIQALVAFFVVIAAWISLRFQWRMALAALIAVVHDVVITVGVYAITGFEVTPATVIAFLTILGFSLYDTIVVFDKVAENERLHGETGKMSYASIVDLAMNQVLMRSLNTSLVAVLPVLSMLVLGVGVLGAVALRDFGIALFIGLLTGAYSSIFIASPALALLKEREPKWRDLRNKLRAKGNDGTAAMKAVLAGGAVAAEAPSADDLTSATKSVFTGSAPRPRKPGR